MRPITDGERRGWQMHAYRVLGHVLDRGWDRELPPVSWRLEPGMRLLGQVWSSDCRDGWDPGSLVAAWGDALGLDVDPVRVTGGGGLVARARGRVEAPAPDGRGGWSADVVVLAEWFEDEHEGAAAGPSPGGIPGLTDAEAAGYATAIGWGDEATDVDGEG